MAIRLGDEAPDFTAESTEGTINFHEYLGDSWGVLFSHPKDFTPVCTTELGAFSKAKAEFDKRNTKLIGLSVDDVTSHSKWAGDIEETQGPALNFPLIGDEDRKVADLYDMIHPNASDTLTVRSVFIIGPDKKIKLTLTYPASTGRQRRRGPAGPRLAAAHRRLQGGHAGQLEGRPGRDHRPGRLRRRGEGAVPEGLQGREALPAGHATAQQVATGRPASPAEGVLSDGPHGTESVPRGPDRLGGGQLLALWGRRGHSVGANNSLEIDPPCQTSRPRSPSTGSTRRTPGRPRCRSHSSPNGSCTSPSTSRCTRATITPGGAS